MLMRFRRTKSALSKEEIEEFVSLFPPQKTAKCTVHRLHNCNMAFEHQLYRGIIITRRHQQSSICQGSSLAGWCQNSGGFYLNRISIIEWTLQYTDFSLSLFGQFHRWIGLAKEKSKQGRVVGYLGGRSVPRFIGGGVVLEQWWSLSKQDLNLKMDTSSHASTPLANIGSPQEEISPR